MICYGMVTTARSRRYTLPALESFLRTTWLAPDDRVLLIDNDGDFELPREFSRIELIRHGEPRGFAANVNYVIGEAAREKNDVVFLNNDLIFTTGWLQPLCVTDRAILLPTCNQQIAYSHEGLELRATMALEDYLGHEATVEEIARINREAKAHQGIIQRPLLISFFCFRLPYRIHSRIGLFDEGYGRGGGEDVDYRLRCYQAGFEVGIARDSYVLHFRGKSTWDSGESRAQTEARDAVYVEHFRAKWGVALSRIMLPMGDSATYARSLGVDALIRQGDWRTLIERCRAVG